MSNNLAVARKNFVLMLIIVFTVVSLVISQEDDGIIVFNVEHRNENSKICTVNPSNSDIHCLTDDFEWVEGKPMWSPDGQFISFEFSKELYIMDTDGSDIIQITNLQSRILLDPVWSPDSSSFVFNSILEADQYISLYMVNIDDTILRKLDVNDGWHNIEPDWSPNGERLVFVSGFQSDDGEIIDVAIFVSDLDGSNLIRLTNDENQYFSPKWSPDGQHIAFWGTEPNGEGGYEDEINLYVASETGENLKQVTDIKISGEYFEWSPDGQHIGFTVWGENVGSHTDIYKVDIVTGELQRLTSDERGNTFGTWSPDGQHIAYSSAERGSGQGWQLFVMNSDGSNPQYIADCGPGVGDCHPDWRNAIEQD